MLSLSINLLWLAQCKWDGTKKDIREKEREIEGGGEREVPFAPFSTSFFCCNQEQQL